VERIINDYWFSKQVLRQQSRKKKVAIIIALTTRVQCWKKKVAIIIALTTRVQCWKKESGNNNSTYNKSTVLEKRKWQ
jgi:hypothetical protein